MSVEEQLNNLLGEIEKTHQILGKISAFYDEFIQGEYKTLGETRLAAICFAEIFANYYTGSGNTISPYCPVLRKQSASGKVAHGPPAQDDPFIAGG